MVSSGATTARARIAGLGVAHPPPVNQNELWHGFFAGHYAGVASGLAKRIFAHSGVTSRHGAINPLVEDPSSWPTSVRMQRYLAEGAIPTSGFVRQEDVPLAAFIANRFGRVYATAAAA